ESPSPPGKKRHRWNIREPAWCPPLFRNMGPSGSWRYSAIMGHSLSFSGSLVMDRFDAMRVFLATVEAGSLSAAARKLKRPLATISRQVAGLETRLKAPLLIRTSRRTELTEAGRGFAEQARRILEQLEDAERAAAGEYAHPRGTLAVSAPLILGVRHVAPVATAFLAAHPDIDL